MRKIIFLLGVILFIGNFSFALEKVTSGLGKVEYQVQWCNSVFGCKTGYFKSLSTTVGPKPTDGFKEDSNFEVICDGNCKANSTEIKKLFNNLKLKGEGVYTITVRTYDNVKRGKVYKCNGNLSKVYKGDAPGNCSKAVIVYKIDKTHPNIVNPTLSSSNYLEIDEKSPYVYVGRSNKSIKVNEYDAIKGNFQDNEYFLTKGYYKDILGNAVLKQINLNNLNNLKTIYYQKGSQEITLKLNLKNYFPKEKDHYNGNISSIEKIKLLGPLKGVRYTWTNVTEQWTKTDTIKNLFGNVDEKVFYLRVYDEAGNYSETPIYVVKDTTAPITQTEFLNTFTFSGTNEEVFYTENKNGPKVDGNNSIPSKFFAANNKLGIKFSLSDKKEGDSNASNAGILKFKIKIENHNSCNSYKDYIFNPEDSFNQNSGTTIEQSWILTHDFSDVDRCLQDVNKTYRYYRAKIISIDDDGNKYENEICDKVGNCTTIAPLVFRVVANKLDNNNSQVQLLSKNLVNDKILANGKSYYQLYLELKDKYGNKIVPVYSQEDKKDIKRNTLTFNFYNGLYKDQINLNNGYGVFKEDMETDNANKFDGELANFFKIVEGTGTNDGKIKPNGIYNVKLYSVVPTVDYYPWLSGSANLVLTKINFKSEDISNGGVNDLTKNSDIGQFNKNSFTGGEDSVILNKGNLSYNKTANKYLDIDSSNYGKIVSNPLGTKDNFSKLANKEIKFAFASPFIIGIDKLRNLSEGVNNIYFYNLWNLDNHAITGGNISIGEKWITNTFYDFAQGSGSIQFTGEKDEIIGYNFDSNSEDLNIIGNFNNDKNISKYTKVSIEPDLSDLVDLNDSHVALGTKIMYAINLGDTEQKVILPADGRGLEGANTGDSLCIFTPDCKDITNGENYDDNELKSILQDIKILGVVSTNKGERRITSEETHKRTIGGDVHKWQIKNKVLKKIGELRKSYGFNSDCEIIDGENICSSFDLHGEKIYLIDGNLSFSGDYQINGRETFIVNGNIFIKGNLYKKDNDSLLSLVAINPDGFSKGSFTLPGSINKLVTKGFILISVKITNLDAFMYAQGSVLSYNGSKIFNGGNILDNNRNIFNQLYVRGGIISSNTIGGSRLPDSAKGKCPWFVANCNTDIAQAFDLIYLRRYMLVDASIYGGPEGKEVPYLPVNIAKDINSYNSNKPYMGGKKYCEISSSAVNCNKDDDSNLVNIPDTGKKYPLYIEYDSNIQTKTPFIFTP